MNRAWVSDHTVDDSLIKITNNLYINAMFTPPVNKFMFVLLLVPEFLSGFHRYILWHLENYYFQNIFSFVCWHLLDWGNEWIPWHVGTRLWTHGELFSTPYSFAHSHCPLTHFENFPTMHRNARLYKYLHFCWQCISSSQQINNPEDLGLRKR